MIEVDHATPAMRRIATDSARMDLVAHGLLFGEGPLWHAAEGALYWTDILGDTIWKWTPGVGRELVMRPSGKANGMTLDGERRRVVAGWGARSIWRVEHDGSTVTLASKYAGRRINTPNDLVVKSDGAIYWTDSSGALFIPGMEGDDVQRYIDTHPVFRLAPGEEEPSVATEGVVSYPNGLAFSPDESVMYVADTWAANVRAFAVADDGSLEGEGTVFYELVGEEPGVADGIKVDVDGNVYVTGPGGVHVTDSAGNLVGRIRVSGHATNMAWGDADWQSLYVTTYSSVYRVRLGVAGVPVAPLSEGA